MQSMSYRYYLLQVLDPALTDARQNPGHRMPHPRKPRLGSRKRVAGSFLRLYPVQRLDFWLSKCLGVHVALCTENSIMG